MAIVYFYNKNTPGKLFEGVFYCCCFIDYYLGPVNMALARAAYGVE